MEIDTQERLSKKNKRQDRILRTRPASRLSKGCPQEDRGDDNKSALSTITSTKVHCCLDKGKKAIDLFLWPQLAPCSSSGGPEEDSCYGGGGDVEMNDEFSFKDMPPLNCDLNLEQPLVVRGMVKQVHATNFSLCMPEDVTELILSGLDKESNCRLRVVSKGWNNMLAGMQMKSGYSGLVVEESFHYRSSNYRVDFFQLDDHGGAALCSLPFAADINLSLQNSYKGLLLFRENSPKKQLILCHPNTPVFVRLPCSLTKFSRNAKAMMHGLTMNSDGEYIVVSLYIFNNGKIMLKIFSFDTKETKVVRVLEYPKRFGIQHLTMNTPVFSFRGVFYFIITGWLLIHRVTDSSNTLINLPHNEWDDIRLHPRCMWQSEGRIYYGCGIPSYGKGFQIWELVDYEFGDISKYQWSLKCEHLIRDIEQKYPEVECFDDHIGPCAYSGEYKILYLSCYTDIIAYHLETGLFTRACTFELDVRQCIRKVFPFYFGSKDAPKKLMC